MCRALQQCGSQEAIPELVGVLDSESIVGGRAAWEALKTITGRDLPQERAAWAGLARELGYSVQDG